MLKEFCQYLDSLIGQTIRGRLVVDSDAQLEGDGTGKVTLTVSSLKDRSIAERLTGVDTDSDELVWHIDNITQYATLEPQWEYWDEFAVRVGDTPE